MMLSFPQQFAPIDMVAESNGSPLERMLAYVKAESTHRENHNDRQTKISSIATMDMETCGKQRNGVNYRIWNNRKYNN